MTKNELNEKQLNNVSGGTVEELGDLINAIYPGEEVGRPLCRAASHVPIGSSVLAATMEQDLLQFGIRSNISTGLAGLGICSKENMYQDTHTGEALTHQQVLDSRLIGFHTHIAEQKHGVRAVNLDAVPSVQVRHGRLLTTFHGNRYSV